MTMGYLAHTIPVSEQAHLLAFDVVISAWHLAHNQLGKVSPA